MIKVKLYLKKLKNLRFGIIKGVNAAAIATDEQLIFPAEKFILPQVNDVFNHSHHAFLYHQSEVPPLYVRSFTNAYCFTNHEEVFSADKNVIVEYTSQKVNPRIGDSKKVFYRTKTVHLNAVAAHLSLSGLENNYYHYLTECLARVYLIEQSKFKPDYYLIANHLPFQAELLDLLGISTDRIIPANANLLLKVSNLIVADLINNWEMVKYRGFDGYQKQWLPNWIKNLYLKNVNLLAGSIQTNTKIYISRDKAVYRNLENKEEINAVFTELGFETVYLEDLSVKQQMKIFANAGYIAGLHGAGFANLYFARSGAKVFEIFSQHYHDTSYRILANTLGLSYSYMIGTTAVTSDVAPQQESVGINAEELKKALITFIEA